MKNLKKYDLALTVRKEKNYCPHYQKKLRSGSIRYLEPEAALVTTVDRYVKEGVLDLSFRLGKVLTAILTADHTSTLTVIDN
ncbi:MAG TPA: hypothetical protein VK536_07070 [Candidatus Limnocylindrales bacterium]|nr:hypothetical protein [Candidatus Limnocylindrales bacterium]